MITRRQLFAVVPFLAPLCSKPKRDAIKSGDRVNIYWDKSNVLSSAGVYSHTDSDGFIQCWEFSRRSMEWALCGSRADLFRMERA